MTVHSRPDRAATRKRAASDGPAESTEGLPRIRWRVALPFIVIAAIGAHSLLPMLASTESLAEIARRVRWTAIAIAVIAQVGSYWGYGLTISASARTVGEHMPWTESIMLSLAASDVGLVAGGPIGYAAATYYWARGLGYRRSTATLCGWLPGAANGIVLVGLALIGAVLFAEHHATGRTAQAVMFAFGALTVALIAGAAWFAHDRQRLLRGLTWMSTWKERLLRRPTTHRAPPEQLATAIHKLIVSRGWVPIMGAAVLQTAFDIVTLYAVFAAVGPAPSVGVLLAGYGPPLLLGRIPVTPGGIGIVEGGMVGLYTLLGVTAANAAVIVLTYRVIELWLPTLAGIACAIVLQRRARKGVPQRAR